MQANVLSRLRAAERRKTAYDVYPLPDCFVYLQFQLVPQFALPHKHKRHGIHRIHFEIQHEAYFLQRFTVQEVSFVRHNHNIFVVDFANNFKLFVDLTFRISPVEFRFDAQVIQQALVKREFCKSLY
jgi:hypothetical protein